MRVVTFAASTPVRASFTTTLNTTRDQIVHAAAVGPVGAIGVAILAHLRRLCPVRNSRTAT